MGLRFRKSLKILPGVKLNVTNKGISSVSLGGKGLKTNIGKKGVRTTASIKGTGLSYSQYSPYQSSAQPKGRQVETNNFKWYKPLIYLGVLMFPYIFVWFTLKPEYSSTERNICFGWLGMYLLIMFFSFMQK